jgi:hypothetical protein
VECHQERLGGVNHPCIQYRNYKEGPIIISFSRGRSLNSVLVQAHSEARFVFVLEFLHKFHPEILPRTGRWCGSSLHSITTHPCGYYPAGRARSTRAWAIISELFLPIPSESNDIDIQQCGPTLNTSDIHSIDQQEQLVPFEDCAQKRRSSFSPLQCR